VRYRAGYEGYAEILRRLGESAHQGCLLVASREQPLREDQTVVRSLRLQGLGVNEGRALLEHRNLVGDEAAWQALVARCAGNPLALQVVGKTAATVFGGDIAAFLAQDVTVFGDIRQLLDEQVERISRQEHLVLNWLAETGEPTGFAELVSNLGPLLGRGAVAEAVEALVRRSLLSTEGDGAFTLRPLVLEYAMALQVARAGAASLVGAAAGMGQRLRVAQPGAPGRRAAAGRIPHGSRFPARGTAAPPACRNGSGIRAPGMVSA
jgi:hypothetical protein